MWLSFRSFSILSYSLLVIAILGLGCESKKRPTGPYCKSDEDCAGGWICNSNHCTRGERSQAEIQRKEAKKDAEKERKRKAKKAARTQTKEGEGKVSFKICPFFKNTFASVGSIVATHTKTKKREIISLQMETDKDTTQSEFTFYSLPLGKYEVYANYGVQVNGQFDTHRLACDPKATKRPCENKQLRVVEVVLPKDMKKDKLECDWIAE
jgi:hypothetical protein